MDDLTAREVIHFPDVLNYQGKGSNSVSRRFELFDGKGSNSVSRRFELSDGKGSNSVSRHFELSDGKAVSWLFDVESRQAYFLYDEMFIFLSSCL